MNSDRKEVLYKSIPMYNFCMYDEYELNDLQKAISEHIASETQKDNNKLTKQDIVRQTIRIISDFDESLQIKLNLYRLENDEEYNSRIIREKEAEIKAIDRKSKKRKLLEIAKEKQAQLMSDPDYLKMLELQTKFGKVKQKKNKQ